MLYSIGIYIYGLMVHIAALFHPKAKKWVNGRKNYWKSLPDVKSENVIWFHCASLGEYDQGKPIMEAWKEKHPNDFILVTFFSPSGYEHIKNKSVGDYTCYLPLDTRKNARRFMRHFQPKKAFFVKYEVWIHHLREAKNHHCELYAVSATFRDQQIYFRSFGGFFRKGLKLFDHIFVQNEMSKMRLYTIEIEHVSVAGDTRYDRVLQRATTKKENLILAPWATHKTVFVVGSSWPKDERILLPFINQKEMQEKVILAPHEIHEAHIQHIIQQLTVSYQRYTNLEKGESLEPDTKVVILDCIGVLADAYRYGNIAYVGGGFKTGLHNILEPAAFGLPVLFGPHHKKFPEAEEFIDAKIGMDCLGYADFKKSYLQFKNDDSIQEKVNAFMHSKKGATKRVMEFFRK